MAKAVLTVALTPNYSRAEARFIPLD